VVSSAAAPVLLVGGWMLAARLQQPPFDQVTDSVSALAAVGAAARWVMTLTFVLIGGCDVITGVALRPAGALGRLPLVTGAVAGLLVAANPEHAGGSLSHAIWASIGFAALAAWPALAWRSGSSVWPRRYGHSRSCCPAAIPPAATLGWHGPAREVRTRPWRPDELGSRAVQAGEVPPVLLDIDGQV
jgi:hypothetical protein